MHLVVILKILNVLLINSIQSHSQIGNRNQWIIKMQFFFSKTINRFKISDKSLEIMKKINHMIEYDYGSHYRTTLKIDK